MRFCRPKKSIISTDNPINYQQAQDFPDHLKKSPKQDFYNILTINNNIPYNKLKKSQIFKFLYFYRGLEPFNS